MARGIFTSASDLVIRSTRARLVSTRHTASSHSLKTYFPSVTSSSPASRTPHSGLSRCLSVTHLHLSSLGHGRGSSLDWAKLPLTSSLCFRCWASLASFAYPACPAHLPVLVGLPPDDWMVHLSRVVVSFLCKPPCFPLCLFVC